MHPGSRPDRRAPDHQGGRSMRYWPSFSLQRSLGRHFSSPRLGVLRGGESSVAGLPFPLLAQQLALSPPLPESLLRGVLYPTWRTTLPCAWCCSSCAWADCASFSSNTADTCGCTRPSSI